MSLLRIGIVGFGRMGQHYYNLINAQLNAQVTAIAKARPINAKEFDINAICGKYPKPVITNNAEEIISSKDVDAIIISSSTKNHFDHISLCAKHKKPFFCEKPLSHDLESGQKLCEEIDKTEIINMIGFNRRYDDSWQRLRSSVVDGSVGQVHSIKMTSRDRHPPPAHYIPDSGGLHFDMAIHDIDACLWLMPGRNVVQVYAKGACHIDPAFAMSNDVDTCVTILTYDNDATATLHHSRRAIYGQDQRAEVCGSDGMVRMGNLYSNTCQFYTATSEQKDNTYSDWMTRNSAAYTQQIQTFVQSVTQNKTDTNCCTVEQAQKAAQIANACKESLKTKIPVDV